MNALSYSVSSLLLGLSLCAGQVTAQSLVEYDPIGMQGSNQLDATFVANGMTANPAFQVGFGGWGNTNVWPVGQIGMASPTLDPLQYIQFDVTSTMSVEYTGLRYSRLSYQGDGNRAAAVRTSLDGFMADVATVTGIDPTGAQQIDFDLSSLPTTTGLIEFRIYFYDAPVAGMDWVDLTSTAANGTGMVLTGFETGFGTSYCGPAVNNTTGGPGVIVATGSIVASDDDLVLRAEGLPPMQFGFFLISSTQGFVPMPGSSQGNLCLSGTIGRYNQMVAQSNAAGTITTPVGTSVLPSPPGGAITGGQTWHFQAWYRDFIPGSGATSNFTDGLSITFQ